MPFMKDFLDRQIIDYSGAKPFHNYYKDRFHFVCCVGEMFYYPKSEQDLIRFRDKWINKFHAIISKNGNARAYSALYLELILKEKVKYRAGLRTRIDLLRNYINVFQMYSDR